MGLRQVLGQFGGRKGRGGKSLVAALLLLRFFIDTD